ncbi:hypothetical protein [Mesorhizobium amorphae]|uniref:hypothetical protein n=1 Tax=Mesorhizobium amorphae TaxID=71433 RepID=UPI0031F52EE0
MAEGVETDDQVAFLRKNNCDEMQGYHFSKPISAADIQQLLNPPGRPESIPSSWAPLGGDRMRKQANLATAMVATNLG